jgi:hypothetical protein
MEITESTSVPATSPTVIVAAYSDEELRVILSRPAEGPHEFPFDFEKLWSALGYSTKSNAVRVLEKYTEGLHFSLRPQSHLLIRVDQNPQAF